jgi:hypothetical protein
MDTQNVLLDASEMLKRAWAIYKQKWSLFAQVMIIPLLFAAIFSLSSGGGTSFNPSPVAVSNWGMYFVLFLAYVVIASVGQLALMYSVKGSAENQADMSIQSYYKTAWNNIRSYWWVMFLSAVIVIGGLILLIVPGIIFAVWYCLASFVLISENLKGMNALNKSKEYVKGRWGKVFFRIFFIGIVSMIASIVFGIVSRIFGSAGMALGQIASGLVITPVVVLYTFMMYQNLKETVSSTTTPVVPTTPTPVQ